MQRWGRACRGPLVTATYQVRASYCWPVGWPVATQLGSSHSSDLNQLSALCTAVHVAVYSKQSRVTSTYSYTAITANSVTVNCTADTSTTQTHSLTLEQQLEMAIMDSSSTSTSTMPSTSHAADNKLLSAVKAEMAVFEVNGKRGRCLEAVYNYLLTVPPTSVEAE